MNRLSILAFLVAASGLAVFTATSVQSQIGPPKNYVNLQPSTPGTSQSGHINVSGSVLAGQHVGGGGGLTGLNATNIASGTLLDVRLSANVPLKGSPNVFSATNQFNAFVGINRSNTITSAEVFGIQGPATGFGGMYVSSTGATAQPFYGYSLQGAATAYHYIDGSDANKWKLNNSGSMLTFTATGSLGIGTTTPSNRLDVNGTAQMIGFKMPTGATASYVLTADALGNGTWQPSSNVPNPLTLTGSQANYIIKGSNSTGLAGIVAESLAATGTSYGLYATSISSSGSGVLGVSDLGSGVYGKHNNATTPNPGVKGESAFGNGVEGIGGGGFVGVRGSSSTSHGVYGTTSSPSSYGVAAYSDVGGTSLYASSVGAGRPAYFQITNSGNPNEVLRLDTAGSGNALTARSQTGATAIYGERLANGNKGWIGGVTEGVYGLANGTTEQNFGGFFQSNSAHGTAVYGASTASSGPTAGGVFETWSPDASAVSGSAHANTGSPVGGYFLCGGLDGRAVYGWAGNPTGTSIGVKGVAGSSAGWGVYAQGSLGASGVKAFRIDHPLDPENKYLLHYSTESPSPQNFYSGNVVTDRNGYAWIELPDYFEAINANFKYQLTIIGKDFAQAVVSEEIVGNRFQVRTSSPNIKVSWRVEADRDDLFVRSRRPRDVIEKVAAERGTYQHPELYGMPIQRGVDYKIQMRNHRIRSDQSIRLK